ncbi:hypothetical protein AOT83_05945 [Mycobacteroides sp. H001]|uniref:hypothetical protein n=1 Tax=Mycobacteroides TaxID=670516 RepID=UPI0007156F06|nr:MULTISPECIES: hypothetical protein [Mycobacteroides]KRQ27770.1 hypothetical protein AOT86_10740 [Mycobacteroides sp. H072]KRQ41725.1 hypothetical protein AOT84_00855 [Mycobacteroides sp. H002]KRQ53955.1 hypothetical protein AOT85_06295 [Mycobacteroides sp. H054]KRQ71791.1 hypothetical protein AOT83_05945 [Mycobacteroides sp. H001]OHU37064.1 hypothetical protein BKG79_15710 [Mycobacteroides chelonae]
MTIEETTGADTRALVEKVLEALVSVASPGWQTVHAAFSMAGGEEIAQAVAVTTDGSVSIPATSKMVQPMREHRRVTIGSQGPWLRFLIDCDSSGNYSAAPDYGDAELPPSQLLPAAAYVRDFQQHPRDRAPVWLLAHIGNEGRQLRPARVAYQQAADGVSGADIADDEIPALPLLWARTAVLAALCRGVDAAFGPRCDPTFQVHQGDGGGCTLARLPGGRAVLSGGRNDSPLLSAAYRGTISWPDLYQGAPTWVHSLYLDSRAARGMLSFCYWFDGQHWYRSELPEAVGLNHNGRPWSPEDELVGGMPEVWTANDTAAAAVELLRDIGVGLSDRSADAVALIFAAESGIAQPEHLLRLLGGVVPDAFDMAEAMAQLDATAVVRQPID